MLLKTFFLHQANYVLCRVPQAMDLREMADYKRKFSRQGAERNIQAVEESYQISREPFKGTLNKV